MSNQKKPLKRRYIFSQLWEDTRELASQVLLTNSKSGYKIRPPFALPELAFLLACARCGECVKICPQFILQTSGEDSGVGFGTPVVVFNNGNHCNFCLKCVQICSGRALNKETENSQATLGRAVIDKRYCLAYNGSICVNCYYACAGYKKAISLEKNSLPVVDEKKCDGCGRCINNCLATGTIRIEAK